MPAAQPDGSVTISSIGLHTNLRALLQSPPDAHSTLGGVDLVARKVKALWVMGGKYPTSVGTGFAECNVAGGGDDDHPTGAAASSYVAAPARGIAAGLVRLRCGLARQVRRRTGYLRPRLQSVPPSVLGHNAGQATRQLRPSHNPRGRPRA